MARVAVTGTAKRMEFVTSAHSSSMMA